MIAERLALDGGSPYRATWLPFHRPCIEDDEIAEVVETLKGGWLTTGPRTKRFEKELAEYVGAKYAVAVNSATAAMHLALDAIGLRPGDEVIVPSYTFTATAEVVLYFEARPVIVDVEPRTMTIDPAAVEAAVTERTKAIMPVDLAGVPCEYDALNEIARRHNLVVIGDSAHALPSRYKDQMIGTVADLTAFSFYVTKPLATGEGGMLTTNNPEWAERAQMMSLHGISHNAWKRYTAEGSWFYEVMAPGFKYNMTDIAAALGLRQLTKQERFLEERLAIVKRYHAAFAALPEVEVPGAPDHVDSSWHLYLLKLNLDRLTVDRADVIKALAAENIGTSVHFIPLHAIVVVGVWSGLGYALVLFLAGLQTIPGEYYDAASVDGAGALVKFFRITLPLLSPTVFFVTVISLIDSLQVFDLIFVMISSGRSASTSPVIDQTQSLVYLFYKNTFVINEQGLGAAVVLTLFIIIVLLTLAQFRLQRRWVHYE